MLPFVVKVAIYFVTRDAYSPSLMKSKKVKPDCNLMYFLVLWYFTFSNMTTS